MAARHLVKYPRDSNYDKVTSHVKVLMDGPRHNRMFVAAAAEQLAQLQSVAPHLDEAERRALAARFPAAEHFFADLSHGSTPRARFPGDGGGKVKLPMIGSAEASPGFRTAEPRGRRVGRRRLAPSRGEPFRK